MATPETQSLRQEWGHYIDGGLTNGTATDFTLVRNPADGEVIAEVPDGTAEDIDMAIEAAQDAFEDWRAISTDERQSILYEIADRIAEHAEELTELETLENGKPLDQSANDVRNAEQRFRFFAGGIDKFYSDMVAHDSSQVRMKVFEPYGVAGIIIPWNWPPMHTGDFTSVTLAAGNTAVLKPSPYTPLSSLRIAQIAEDVLPDGVLNVVTGGVEPGAALASHEDIDVLAFTGSDVNGEKVLESAAKNITPTMLELGGKNPAIVLPDADLDEAAQTTVVNAFYNSGQACSNPERLLLHEDIYDDFMSRVRTHVESLTVGDGRDPDTQIGPLANAEQVEKFESYLDLAESEGADIVAQSDLPSDPDLEDGHWAAPTVFEGVDNDARIAQEEVFGPFLCAIPFSDIDEAVELANDVPYGLTAAIWTSDLRHGHQLASRIEAGVVGVNHPSLTWQGLPFGGYKRSGNGRKNDFIEAMREFTQVKSIEVNLEENQLAL